MKNYVALLALISALFFAEDSELDQILNENTDNINLSEESQQEVDSLATEKDSLLAEWKVVVKQVEGLKIYNARFAGSPTLTRCASPSPEDSCTRQSLSRSGFSPMVSVSIATDGPKSTPSGRSSWCRKTAICRSDSVIVVGRIAAQECPARARTHYRMATQFCQPKMGCKQCAGAKTAN